MYITSPLVDVSLRVPGGSIVWEVLYFGFSSLPDLFLPQPMTRNRSLF